MAPPLGRRNAWLPQTPTNGFRGPAEADTLRPRPLPRALLALVSAQQRLHRLKYAPGFAGGGTGRATGLGLAVRLKRFFKGAQAGRWARRGVARPALGHGIGMSKNGRGFVSIAP